jgi:hypothetical protein
MPGSSAPEPHEAVQQSLEAAAERCDDLSVPVYERFFEAHPAASQMMKHVDERVRGRMLNDVLELLMVPAAEDDRPLIAFEVASHRGYGVPEALYVPFLTAIRDTVRALAPEIVGPRVEAGWNRRIDQLLGVIREMNAREEQRRARP